MTRARCPFLAGAQDFARQPTRLREAELTRTHASSSRALNGFTRYSSAPASSPAMRDSSPARADSRITGTWLRAGSARKRAHQFEAVHRGHHHVGQDEVRRMRMRRPQGGGAVFDRDDVVAGQQPLDVVPHVAVVVGHQDASPRGDRRRRRTRSPASAVSACSPGSQRRASCTKASGPAAGDGSGRAEPMRSAGRCARPSGMVT